MTDSEKPRAVVVPVKSDDNKSRWMKDLTGRKFGRLEVIKFDSWHVNPTTVAKMQQSLKEKENV